MVFITLLLRSQHDSFMEILQGYIYQTTDPFLCNTRAMTATTTTTTTTNNTTTTSTATTTIIISTIMDKIKQTSHKIK